jgi:hypothetical protein
MLTYNKDTDALELYDGSAFGPVGSDAGLIHINTTSFSAVASQSFNDVFTSAYKNYKIMTEIETTASAGFGLSFRLRASGSDNTTNNYHYGSTGGRTNNANISFGVGSTNVFATMQLNNNQANHLSFDVLYPQTAKRTYLSGGVTGQDGTSFYGGVFAGYHNTTTAFDGFSIITGSGTITGEVRIYGYNG